MAFTKWLYHGRFKYEKNGGKDVFAARGLTIAEQRSEAPKKEVMAAKIKEKEEKDEKRREEEGKEKEDGVVVEGGVVEERGGGEGK